jgi:hypothetical protein
MNFLGKIFLIATVFTWYPSQVLCQKLSVETLLDTNIIKIGDQIDLHYNIEKKKEVHLHLPDFGDTLVNGIEVVSKPVIDSSEIDDELWKILVSIKITSFDTGVYCIPPQSIVFKEKNFSDTLLTRAAYLMVQGVALDTTNMVRDIKGPATVPVTVFEILCWVVPILLLIGLGYFLFIYFRRKKANEPMFKPLKPEEPAYITALRELDKIKSQKLWQQKQVKDYYTRITHVIRWYIEKRFNIVALELTSDEILRHIRHQKLDNVNYTNLESLLNLADLVKFAKGEPDPEENITHLDNAYDFIKRSKEVNLENQSGTTIEE